MDRLRSGVWPTSTIRDQEFQACSDAVRASSSPVRHTTGIDPGPGSRESLEHRYWIQETCEHFEEKGYDVTREHQIKGNGAVDLLAERPGKRIAIEVETGKSDIKTNIAKVHDADFDRFVLIATSPAAVGACQKAMDAIGDDKQPAVELLTWLDLG